MEPDQNARTPRASSVHGCNVAGHPKRIRPVRNAEQRTGGTNPLAVAVGDFNRDGILDFADADTSLQIFLGDGDGTFGLPINYLDNTGALYAAAADFNRDGKLDLAVADENGLYTLTGNGDGTFQATPINSATLYSPSATAIGDFNGDGKPDLAIAEQFGTVSQVEVMFGNGDGTFSSNQTYPVNSFPTAVTVADFRKNGKLDIAAACLYGATSILLGNSDGTFTRGQDVPTYDSARIISADFNGDGKPDLAITAQSFPAGVDIALGNGDGTFQTPVFYVEGSQANFIAAGDFNGDHKTDLLVTDYGPGNVIALLNTGVVSFSPNAPINFPFQLIGTASPAQTVTLTNTGSKALSIAAMKISNSFQQTNSCGKSVAPGAKCKIEITFKPTNTNTISGTLTISDSASSKPQVIEVIGTGTIVKLAPSKLVFGEQKVGTSSAPQTVTVSNQGTAALSITQIYIGGTNQHDFTQTNDCPTSLKGGASCVVNVIFDPIKTGARSALLGLIDNGGGSPQTAPLTGSGD